MVDGVVAMMPRRWDRIEQLYHAAVERPPADRRSFVDEEAAGDVEVQREVEALLRYDATSAGFLERPALEYMARAVVRQIEQSPQWSGRVGPYDILRSLGAGGMGEVYLARDTRLGRNVALKRLQADPLGPGPTLSSRQEALATSALNHPNILTIYEIGEHGGTEFIASEHVEGTTLRERLKRGSLPLSELIGIGIQVAEGLTAAHAAGVIHRDIKPENVMLRPDGLVKILDFGIATTPAEPRPDAHTPEGHIVGTLGYMSPEQAGGLTVDSRSDIWSLGVLLHEMATGRPPGAGPVSPGSPPRAGPTDRLEPGVPPELLGIVRRTLSASPADRYQTAAAVADDLRELQRVLEDHAGSGARVARGLRARVREAGSARWWTLLVALCAANVILLAPLWRGPGAVTVDSLAVLPLELSSASEASEYLADGLAAALRSRLSEFTTIVQPAPSEVSRYRLRRVTADQAGRELGVSATLTGTLHLRGEIAVVRLALVSSADGKPLWQRRFVKPAADTLNIQDEIARNIVDDLAGAQRQPPNRGSRDTTNSAAYQLYLKGRYHVERRTRAELTKGIEYLREAIAADPDYGRAHAKLADAYFILPMTSDVPPRDYFPLARAAAERALALDPDLSDARIALGMVKFWFDWDWLGAEEEFKKAIAIDNRNPVAYRFYGNLLSNLGDHTAALQLTRRALDFEPHSAVSNTLLGQVFYHQRRYDETLAQLHQALALDSQLWMTQHALGRVYERKRMYPEALDAFQKARQLGGPTVTLASAAYTHAASGNREEARRILEELAGQSKTTYVPSSHFALIHLGLGKHAQALDWLERAFDERDIMLSFLTAEPKWEDLAGEPRFLSLLGRVGLTR
jgi:eukaryotic-like serine/threonine-protein kinase